MLNGLLSRAPHAGVRAVLLLAIIVGASWPRDSEGVTLSGLRHSSSAERTRVVLDFTGKSEFTHRVLSEPPRVVVDIPDGALDPGVRALSISNGFVKQVRLNDLRSGRVQVVVELERVLDYSIFTLDKPDRIVVDIKHPDVPAAVPAPKPVQKDTAKKETPKKDSGGKETAKQEPVKKESAEPETAKQETAKKETGKKEEPEKVAATNTKQEPATKVKAPPPTKVADKPKETNRRTNRRGSTPVPENRAPQGQWIIAIDAGHGGEDNGARYHDTNEKDITLALAKELKKELGKHEGVKAILVRKGDYFIPLRRRWTLAEKQGADLFVSLHCNASKNRKAEGTEVFFLSLKGATDEQADELAQRENAVDEKMGVNVPEDDLNQIIFDMMQTDVLAKSEIMAEICLEQLFELGTAYGRGVKQAGFAVLKSPRMPSVLVEAAFLSNRKENKMLRDSGWRESFGHHLAEGIVAYIRTVDPGMKAER